MARGRNAGTAAAAKPTKSLKVAAVATGLYPKDVRRRKGSVFALAHESHFSDSTKEIIRRGKKSGTFGWMAWADPEAPERTVTAAEQNNAEMAQRVGGSSDVDVI